MSELRPGVRHNASLRDLELLAGHLWSCLGPGSVVWLTGELGSGKTTFVQAIARVALAERALSPTFALVHEYLARQFGQIQIERLTLIEWPERAGAFAPEPDAHIAFAHAEDPESRLVERLV